MLVTANEMIYDTKNNRVHAVGGVQIYYDGGILEAESLALIERYDPRMLAYVRGEQPVTRTRALRNV